MGRRRLYAPLERMPDELERDAAADTELIEHQDPPAPDSYAGLLDRQRGAGNASTTRLLRMRAQHHAVAREPEATAAAPLDIHAMTKRYFDQLRREGGLLHSIIVPRILERLAAPPRIGTSESLAELTLLARDELERFLQASASQGAEPTRVVSPVEEIQRVVVAVARERGIIVPGHRPVGDQGELESEAKALAALAGVKLPDFAIEASAAGFKFRFDGELSVSGNVGRASVAGSGAPSGGKVEGKLGPVAAGGQFTKDSAKLDLKIAAGQIDFKANIAAKAGQATTWSAELEIKIAGGADPVPDPASLAEMVKAAEHDVRAAARYLGVAVAGSAEVTRSALEQQLAPAKESIEKVAGYIEKHKAKPAHGPSATIGVSAKGETGGVSGMMTLTITF